MLSLITGEFLLKNTIALTGSILTNINFIRSYKIRDDELDKIFIDCDILSDIGIIKTYLQEHRNESATFKASVQNLNETLFYLEAEITTLTTKIRDHHQKWFYYYRYYDIIPEKKKIFMLIHQMNHRFEMLLKIK